MTLRLMLASVTEWLIAEVVDDEENKNGSLLEREREIYCIDKSKWS